MKECVVDASFLLSAFLPDELNLLVEEAMDDYRDGKLKLHSISLLDFEILNALTLAVRRKRITKKQAFKLGSDYSTLEIKFHHVNFEVTQKLAIKYGLTFYDASYLYLSKRLKIPLFTFDKDLKGAHKSKTYTK